MSALLLHIGSPKAGSSAIQASLLEAAADLREQQGLLVLPPNPYRRPLPSGFLAACHLPPEQLPRYLAARQRRDPLRFAADVAAYEQLLHDLLRLGRPASSRRWRARLQRAWADGLRRPSRPALLSSEYLFRLPPGEIRRLRERFTALGVRRFRVLVYVREPVSAYGSFLQQWLRLSTDLDRYHPWQWHYQLRSQLEAWAAVFAPEELVVRPFRRDQLQGGSVVSDFYGQCSSWFEQPLQGPEPRGVNEALTAEALSLVQELLAPVPPQRRLEQQWLSSMARFLRLLRQEAAALPCTPVQLQPWLRRLVWERHADDLAWLEQRHGIRFEAPEPELLAAPLPARRDPLRLEDLLVSCGDPALTQELRQRQLQAVVREGLR